jgi:transposase InsO family protein
VRDEQLKTQIRRVWDANYQLYGARKLWAQLRREGITVARCTVERLMGELGISGAVPGKPKPTTIVQDPVGSRPADLVERQFTPPAPNRLWVADLTYLRTWSGFVYAALVIDACSRMVVGWQLATHLRTDLALDALEMAIWQRNGAELDQLVHHSDRGVQRGLNWSSQHLDRGGADGDDARAAAGGAAVSGADPVTGPADGGVASGPCSVLGGDRSRREDRGRRGGGARWRRACHPLSRSAGSVTLAA